MICHDDVKVVLQASLPLSDELTVHVSNQFLRRKRQAQACNLQAVVKQIEVTVSSDDLPAVFCRNSSLHPDDIFRFRGSVCYHQGRSMAAPRQTWHRRT